MISLLQPAYLLALLGLIIPLAIHLWSRREGRVLKVGTIRWMQKTTSSRFSRVKIHDWLLLLLRATIIFIIVLILAELVWKESESENLKKWALVEPEILESVYALEEYLPELERDGYEIRHLSYAFEKIDIREAEVAAWDVPLERLHTRVPNKWEIVKAASLLDRPADSILVLTRGYQKDFSGTKPETDVPTGWMLFPEKDTHHFIYDARYVSPDSIEVKIGRSSGDQTRILTYTSSSQNLSALEIAPGDVRINLNLNEDTIFLTEERRILDSRHLRKSETWRVAIAHHDTTLHAARTWRAAMEALSQHQKTPVEISLHKHPAKIPPEGNFHWLVDLTAGAYDYRNDPIATVFTNKLPKDKLDERWFRKQPGNAKNVYSINRNLQQQQDIHSLPGAILEILRKNDSTALHDMRTLGVRQIELVRAMDTEKERKKEEFLYSSQKMEPFLWLLVVVLMVTERIVASRKDTA